MDLFFEPAQGPLPLDRVYVVTAVLNTFKMHRHVEVQIFRPGASDDEVKALQGKNLVAPADPSVPPQVLQGATEEAALRCLLECLTEDEARALATYLGERYADQFESLTVCPLEVPVPLGVGPLEGITEGKNSGFIRFDAVRDWPLPFRAWGYYDLDQPADDRT
ncbi:hypothetical protein [uncultured Desulfovibrio sp.]|uniref:hypothetical protein n=1 Tax=uncultured Desulfovibrio sp. TaxID=167968 RepID=UPI002636DFF8|nr:hypothetical protein [uncultured Desulfovibrio sp.]